MASTIPAKEIRRSLTIDDGEPELELGAAADLALLQALMADPLDNLVYRGFSRNFYSAMTLAAKVRLGADPWLTPTQPP